jgi:DNA modification methylase
MPRPSWDGGDSGDGCAEPGGGVRPTRYLLAGDARQLPLASASVQCVVTSPPYWGLRDYGLPLSVWGGNPEHAHAWGPELRKDGVGNNSAVRGKDETWTVFAGVGAPKQDEQRQGGASAGALCPCGAWRGVLGLEPTPELYVQHLVEIFREVRRVLRNDGTCWVNLGDSYSSIGWKAGGAVSVGSAGPYVRSDYVIRRGSPKSNWGTAPESMAGGAGKRGDSQTARRTELGDDPYRLKVKDLVGIPWRVAFALQADGWYLRSDIIWAKPNPMPESITDRPTKSHEYLFLLTKAARYYYDGDAIREPMPPESIARYQYAKQDTSPGRLQPNGIDRRITHVYDPPTAGRNRRSVWSIATEPYPEAHFAVYPEKLVEPCILAGTSERGACPTCGAPWGREVESTLRSSTYGDSVRADIPGSNDAKGRAFEFQTRGFLERMRKTTTTTGWSPTCACPPADPVPCRVLDPFAGSGTTVAVAERLGRVGIGVELKAAYLRLAWARTRQMGLL